MPQQQQQLQARGPAEPGVHAKELVGIKLLNPRIGWQRLDLGPFLALYLSLTVAVLVQGIRGNRHAVTLLSYSLGAAALSHVMVFLFTHWNTGVNAVITCKRATSLQTATRVQVIPDKFHGSAEIVPLSHKLLHDPVTGKDTYEVGFEFRKQRYVYDDATHIFHHLKYPIHDTFGTYVKSSGYGSPEKVLMAADTWGLNQFEVPVPEFLTLLKEQMLAPFFVFQIFCVGLWCLDEYWYYSLFTLFMLVVFECTVVFQRQRNLKELHSLQTPKQRVQVYRCGRWEVVPGEALLPGDLISIGRPTGGDSAEDKVVPADCLLLAGNCIVEEAVLTGESTPQWKLPVSGGGVDPLETLHIKAHRAHVIFGGTKMLQHTADKEARIRTPDGGCLALVLRTGFETSQGQLMRTILYSTERITANSVETGLFIAFLLIFAVSASYYVLKHGLQDPKRDRFKLVLNCVMIITSVIPPELPMELTIAVNHSLVALAKKGVYCTEPFRIPFAGKVEVCCFDKTGTLTSDHLLLQGVSAVEGHPPEELLPPDAQLPPAVALVLACCQSLVQVDGNLVGDPLEKAGLAACQWTYSSDVALSPNRKLRANLLQRYHFSSHLRRMSAMVTLEDTGSGAGVSHWGVMKGAPEVVRGYLSKVPVNYDDSYKQFAAQGARVIALARRSFPQHLSAPELRALPRAEVEQDMEFVGFAIFQCPLKPESEPSLAALAQGSHLLVMITGDAPLTAVHAASQVHIVDRDVLILQHKLEVGGEEAAGLKPTLGSTAADDQFEWCSPDGITRLPFQREWDELLRIAAEYDLSMTGDALAHVEAAGLAPKLIPMVQVFARTSPEQKELVLRSLRAAGWTTLMVGDGTNDVGGLKAAHVGVALLAPSELAEKIKRARAAAEKQQGKSSKAAQQLVAGGHGAAAAGGPETRKKKQLAAGDGSQAAGERPTSSKSGKQKNHKPGTAMLEELRKTGRPVPPSMERMATWLDSMEEDQGNDVVMVKPGDASMAAPFTAKAASVAPVTDILKQGRCTLVTTVQMFKILGLLCLSTAYALSVMYLEGVKLSDVQATTSGMLTAGMFYFISNAAPLQQLSEVRPHSTIFNLYFFGSLLGQFAVQLTFLVYMYKAALAAMPSEERQDSESEFKPNLVNSCCYLVEQTVQLTTFAVNYVGAPYNTPLMENAGMKRSIYYGAMFIGVLVTEAMPSINEGIGMVPIPIELRSKFVIGALLVFVITFSWEELLRRTLPARRPPRKGYEVYARDLQRINAQSLDRKKRS